MAPDEAKKTEAAAAASSKKKEEPPKPVDPVTHGMNGGFRTHFCIPWTNLIPSELLAVFTLPYARTFEILGVVCVYGSDG